MSYEKKGSKLAPIHVYRRRQLQALGIGGIWLGASLSAGVLGYHFAAGLDWLDALVNASMILGGMGPVDVVGRPGGKVFASIYALYSGVALLTSVGIILQPSLHRLLHKFHAAEEDEEKAEQAEERSRTHRPRRS